MVASQTRARTQVLRSAALFTPFLAVTLFVLGLLVRDVSNDGASGGRVVGMVIVGFVALLLGFQVMQSLRDLASGTVQTMGLVERRWNKNDFFLFRNSYIFVDRNVYRLDPEQFIDIELGDTVRVVHTPHTAAVDDIEVVARAQAKEAGDV